MARVLYQLEEEECGMSLPEVKPCHPLASPYTREQGFCAGSTNVSQSLHRTEATRSIS